MRLFCDCKTDEEKSNFFLSGDAVETGVIAPAISNDVAMAYHRCAQFKKENDALRARIEAMEKQEPVAWCATDETGTVIEALGMNQSRRFDTALYLAPGAQPAPSVPECPYPCGWKNLLTYAIKDGAYLARSINEDEPVTENARAATMRMVMRLRDVLMALNNATPEAKP